MGSFFEKKLFEGQIKSIYTPFYFRIIMRRLGGVEVNCTPNPKILGEIIKTYEMPSGLYVAYSDCSSKEYKTALVRAFGDKQEVLNLETKLAEELKIWEAKPESEKQLLWRLAFPPLNASVRRVDPK